MFDAQITFQDLFRPEPEHIKVNYDVPVIGKVDYSKEYLKLKEKFPDHILLIKVGDFYEVLYEDAAVVAKLLDIALLRKHLKDGTKIPMTGFPCFKENEYVSALTDNNLKIAIANN